MKNVEVDIPIDLKAKPCFLRVPPVLYALKDKKENELERLVKEEIYKPVGSFKWLAPTVCIIKDDGSFCMMAQRILVFWT